MRASRVLIAAAVTGTGALLPLAPAEAAPQPAPQPQIVQFPGRDTAGDNGFCQFSVTEIVTSSSQLRGGRVFAGRGFATVINDLTGKSLTYNVSGPGTVTSTPDGGFAVDAGGPNLFATPVASSYPGVPQLAYTTGHLQFTVDGLGNTTSYSLRGKTTDVCAALT
jgi:hypothetical protein